MGEQMIVWHRDVETRDWSFYIPRVRDGAGILARQGYWLRVGVTVEWRGVRSRPAVTRTGAVGLRATVRRVRTALERINT